MSIGIIGWTAHFTGRAANYLRSWHNNLSCRHSCEAGFGTRFGLRACIYARGPKRRISIGSQSQIHGELKVFAESGSIAIGDFSFVGPGTRIWSAASVSVGDRVLISHDCEIHDCNAHPLDASARHLGFVAGQGHPMELEGVIRKPITIEDDAWIGFKSIVMKGVRIGKGAVVAANSLVLEDVPPWTLVAGVPARPIKDLSPAVVEDNVSQGVTEQ